MNQARLIAFVLAGAAALLAGCASLGRSGVGPQGAQWEEISIAGRGAAEGVVAARDGMVYATDITPTAFIKPNPGGTIWRYDPEKEQTTKFMEPSGMANGLHIDRNGDLLIAQGADTGGRAIARRNLATGRTTVIVSTFEGKRFVSPNDITSDARGRIYFTDARFIGNDPMEMPNAVYRIDPDGRVVRLSTDILRPNGIEVSPDGRRLYVAASNIDRLPKNPNGPEKDRFGFPNGGVVAYDLDGHGDVSNPRPFFRSDDFLVDSMAMDTDGNLYVTQSNGNPKDPKGEIVVLRPDGSVLEHIATPQKYLPTNVGFGRGRDSGSLYLTTLNQWRLFRIRTVRKGLYWDDR